MGSDVGLLIHRNKVVSIIVGIGDLVAVVAAFLGVLYQPVRQVIVVGGFDPGGGVHDGCQCAGIVVGVGYRRTVLVGLLNDPTVFVIGIRNFVSVAIGQCGEVLVSVRRIGIDCKGLVTNLYTGAMGKSAVSKAIGGRAGANGRQHIVRIGVGRGKCMTGVYICSGCGQAEHPIVGVFRPGRFRVVGVFHPLQHVGIFIIMVSCDFCKCICSADQSISIVRIVSGAADGFAAVGDFDFFIVSVDVVDEFVHLTAGGGGSFNIMVNVICVGHDSGRRNDLC